MTQAEAEKWFRRYAGAFDSFDAGAIADHLHIPSTVLGRGYVVAFNTRADAVQNFEKGNEHHRNLGYHRAEFEECVVSAVDPDETGVFCTTPENGY